MIAASAQASSEGSSGGVAAGGVAGAGAPAELEPAGGGADDWANDSAAGASAEESPASPTVFRKRRRAWAPGEAGSGPGDRDMRASLKGVASGPREATPPPPWQQPARRGGGARASGRRRAASHPGDGPGPRPAGPAWRPPAG